MNAESPDELREELTRLEAEEATVSAQRRHLHHQIDFGYASAETRAREREVSDRRQELHHRIDQLRTLLGLEAGGRRDAPELEDARDGLEGERLL